MLSLYRVKANKYPSQKEKQDLRLKMTNHYKALVGVGFLSNVERQLEAAQDAIMSTHPLDDHFHWDFDVSTKKMYFDMCFSDLYISEFVANYFKSTPIEKDDVLVINTSVEYIYCSYSKKAIRDISLINYNETGLMPYYTTKRKVQGKFIWFCLAQPAMLFIPPNYN